jgi:hypothetical protein
MYSGEVFCICPHLQVQNYCSDYAETLDCKFTPGRAMAQAVSRWPPTAEARVRARVDPCGICGGQSVTGAGYSSSSLVFPWKYHSTIAPYSYITAT